MYFVLASFQKWEMIGRWLLGGRGGVVVVRNSNMMSGGIFVLR